MDWIVSYHTRRLRQIQQADQHYFYQGIHHGFLTCGCASFVFEHADVLSYCHPGSIWLPGKKQPGRGPLPAGLYPPKNLRCASRTCLGFAYNNTCATINVIDCKTWVIICVEAGCTHIVMQVVRQHLCLILPGSSLLTWFGFTEKYTSKTHMLRMRSSLW